MEPYYYTKMSKPQQAVYYAIYQGLMALSDSFQVPKLEGRELSDVFFQLRLDHPEIFWAEGFHYRYYQDSANITFLPEYIFCLLYTFSEPTRLLSISYAVFCLKKKKKKKNANILNYTTVLPLITY